ncbi:MAG: hypothetical protein U0174_27555 [Polyangiaceae bacterium]
MRRPSFPYLLLFVIAFCSTFVGCPCVRSTVNNSESLRWWLFSNYGAQRMCPEMLKRGVPLKLAALGNASVGRFFPQQCQVQVDDARHVIVMTASGTGYASMPVTKRVGFYCGLSVEYRPDFRMEEDSIYVWGRFSRLMAAPDLRILGVENPVVSLATMTPVGNLATVLGQGIVAGEIGRGFTVIQQDDGTEFSMDILMPPNRPRRQFQPGKDHVLLASDLAEVQPQAREFLGPFEVPGNGQALFAKFQVQGNPILTAVVDKQTGDAWRQSYELAQPLGPPPGPVYGSMMLQPGMVTQTATLNRGMYYIVLENQASAAFSPLGVPLPFTPGPATVGYSVEVGDRP